MSENMIEVTVKELKKQLALVEAQKAVIEANLKYFEGLQTWMTATQMNYDQIGKMITDMQSQWPFFPDYMGKK